MTKPRENMTDAEIEAEAERLAEWLASQTPEQVRQSEEEYGRWVKEQNRLMGVTEADAAPDPNEPEDEEELDDE